MHYSFLLLSLPLFTLADIPGTIPLGVPCTSTWECSSGASCYASSSSLNPLCGNFDAACTSDSQCAFNTCISGSCSGLLPSSSSSPPAAASTTSSAPTESGLALGATCTTTSQCANAAQCYAVNAMEVERCGNFGASCTTDSQCAFNSCVSGSCQGPLSSTTPSPSSNTASGSKATGTSSATPQAKGSTITSTGVPAGFSTSVTVAGGVTSSVLVNAAGSTTSFGAVATSVTSVKGSAAGKVVSGKGTGIFVLAGGLAMWLF
ncbi:hypothetical protein L207DRAFT_590717 [Hyaloscypha variabilis F]|uniref:Uncharacterized protein n=1 Tax=Hyaloscypha variabilis (strain UAMH 11265 / GT02V1 / F) TaxID=1149755 RepID=A0A2J6R1S6_HYAVF|nr:hypothetical protein L207DRAFT_590717 [Hyaloscypha variabilis F]